MKEALMKAYFNFAAFILEVKLFNNNDNNKLSVTDDCILAMLLELSRNGRPELTQILSTHNFWNSVIQRDALHNTFGPTAPGNLGTCPMCKGVNP